MSTKLNGFSGVDWSVRKPITVSTNGKVDVIKLGGGKVKYNAWEKYLTKLSKKVKFPHGMGFETGGAEGLKVRAHRAGFTVFYIPGKLVNEVRQNLVEYGHRKEIEDDDKFDAWLIEMMFTDWGYQNIFYQYSENHIEIYNIRALYRRFQDLKKFKIKYSNQSFAQNNEFDGRFEEELPEELRIEAFNVGSVVKEIEIKQNQIKEKLEKMVAKYSTTQELYKIKGISVMAIAGMIGEIGVRSFDNNSGLKHYADLLPKKDSNNKVRPNGHGSARLRKVLGDTVGGYSYDKSINRYVRHAGSLLLNKGNKYYELYISMKEYYKNKNEDWSIAKADSRAIVETCKKFLYDFWDLWQVDLETLGQ
jgi:hypothetical protein